MVNILILSRLKDIHDTVVSVALGYLGARCYRFYGHTFPLQTDLSMQVAAGNGSNLTIASGGMLYPSSFDIVWNRRCKPPELPSHLCPIELNDDDRLFVEREVDQAFEGFLHVLARKSFWANPYEAAKRAQNKMLQLHVAQEIGLRIPETLVSNSPKAIRSFLTGQEKAVSIYKPFYTMHWALDGGDIASLPTTAVSAEQLPSDPVLRMTPGIFQRRLNKAFEVRATFFGRSCVAVKIDTGEQAVDSADYRVSQLTSDVLSQIELPLQVYDQCCALMRELGLVFGCFDFIVTPGGDYVFLEVNEMGQFLWIENACPEIPLLDMMCHFLVQGDSEFQYMNAHPKIRYHEVLADPSVQKELTVNDDKSVLEHAGR